MITPVQECENVIFNDNIDAKKKIKYIDKKLESSDSKDEITYQSFGRLYSLLASKIGETSPKHKMQCLEKAQNLFTKVTNNPQIEEQISCIRLQLANTHIDRPSGKTSPKSLQKIPSLFSKKKERRLSTNKNEELPKEHFIASEFDKKFSNLYNQIADYRDNIKTTSSSEEPATIQNGIRSITDTHAEFTEVIKKIKSGEINKMSAETLLETSKALSEDLEWITDNIDTLDISQEKDIYKEKCQSLLKKLNAYITKAPEAIKEAKEVPNSPTCRLVSLCKECCLSQQMVSELMKKKIVSSKHNTSYLNDLFYVWSSFFQFTEKNFFMLCEVRRAKLYEVLLYAEPICKKNVYDNIKDPLSHETYITILAQKHPFINDAKLRQENFQQFRGSVNLYRSECNKKLENAATLEEIFNTNFSSSQTPRAQIIRCKLNYSNEKDKVKELIGNVLSTKGDLLVALAQCSITYMDKNEQISLLLKNIQCLFQQLSKFNLSNHSLEPKDLLKVAYIVEKTFFYHSFEERQKGQIVTDDNLFLTKKDSYFNRSILIDIKKKAFTILSKLHGDLKKEEIVIGKKEYVYIQGGIKKISASASFFKEGEQLVHKETILATPKNGKVFDKKFIDYLFEFNHARGLIGCYYYMEYTCPKHKKIKQLVIQDRATGDLEQFISAADFTQESIWKDIFHIFIDIAFGLDYMHSRGYIHWDLKLENILFYIFGTKCIAMINDFDTTFKIRNSEQPGWDYPDYGSIKFRAPETNAKEQPPFLTEEAATARDMFALGCILLNILSVENPLKINEMTVYEKIRDAIITLEEVEAIIEECKTNLTSYKDFIRLAAYSLAHPNPNKRWTAAIFMEKITSFQPIEPLRKWQTSKIIPKKKEIK